MRRFLLSLAASLLWAQQADLTVLVETSQLTCGKPVEIARQALKVLCQQGGGTVAVGTFSRLRGGRAITWLTTPVQPLSELDVCLSLFDGIKSRCDSIYQVNLLHAVEEAITRGYSSSILVLASGKETGRGLTAGEVRHLAKKKGVQLYFASIGWLVNDEATQGFFKQISGTLEGEEGTLIVVDPASGQAIERLRNFITQAWRRSQAAAAPVPLPKADTRFPEGNVEPSPLQKEQDSTLPGWVWIALAGAGGVLVLVLLFSLLRPKSTAPAPARPAPPVQTVAAPAPGPVAPPAPVLRRLIVYYPHTQQDVNLAPTTAPITLGRAPDNTIVIADNTVSSHHARLFLQGTQWYVQDLGSTNGTFVNEQRVSQHPVRTGDKVRLGAIVIQIAG